MTEPTEAYTEEFINVRALEIDRRVQRTGLNKNKVARMVREWNPLALGLVHVSFRRNTQAYVILDGQHRHEAARIVTDNEGELWCRVFRDLSLEQEAQMFLDLNHTTQPSLLDKFKVEMSGDSPQALASQDIARIAHSFGWTVARVPGPGNINCVRVLQDAYARSVKMEREPNLLHLTLLTITEAWGTTDRAAVTGQIVGAVAAIFDEYGSNLELDRLINVLRETEGGPTGLVARAQTLAKARGSRQSMAVAEIIMEHYNRGLRARSLGAWRRR